MIKSILIILVLVFMVGCDKKDDKELSIDNKKQVIDFVKLNMGETWDYSDDKVIVDDKLNTTIVLNNVENVVDCYDSSLMFSKKLNEKYDDNIKMNELKFTCKLNGNVTSSVLIGNALNINYDEFEKVVSIYDSNDALITKTIDELRNDIKNEFISKCKTYKFKEIFRYPDKYVSEFAKFTGEVVQVMEQDGYYNLRLNVTKDEYGYYEDTIMVGLPVNALDGRILEEDIITVYGILQGVTKYQSIFGEEITLPAFEGRYVELVK